MKILNTKFIAAIGVAFCFVVIGLGAWTRLADAGLGCPDWPGCYGFITYPTTVEEIAIAEQLYPDSPVEIDKIIPEVVHSCLLYTSPSPRDQRGSRMPSSA